MLAFDGLLVDMTPHNDELHTPGGDRWRRFISHLPDVAPITAGVDLTRRLDKLGWQYALSVTWPPRVKSTTERWIKQNLPIQPTHVHFWPADGKTRDRITIKRKHALAGGPQKSPSPLVALFVEPDDSIAEFLTDDRHTVPAITAADVADMSNNQLAELLDYSRRKRLNRWAKNAPTKAD